MPALHADEICPNWGLLIVSTCYVSLRSSACGLYFFLALILKFQLNKNFSSFGTFQYGNSKNSYIYAFGVSAVTEAKSSGFQKLPEAEGIKVIYSFDNPHHHPAMATRIFLFICAPLFSLPSFTPQNSHFIFKERSQEIKTFFIADLQWL